MRRRYRGTSSAPREDCYRAVKVLTRRILKAMGQELALGHTEQYDRFHRSIAAFHNGSSNNLYYSPPPAFQPSFFEDRNACYEDLLQAAKALGCNVTETFLNQAYGTNSGKEICIDPRQDSTNRLITLAHELAHRLLHWGPNRNQLTKKIKECHAQATAEVVVSYMGIAQSWTRDYLLSFQVTPADLEKESEIISEAACAIIHALHVVGFSPPAVDEGAVKRELILV